MEKLSIDNQRGSVIIMAYLVIALAIVFIGPLMLMSSNYLQTSYRNLDSVSMKYLAEASTEQVAYDLVNAVANFAVEPSGSGAVWNDMSGTSADFLESGKDLDYECSAVNNDYTITNDGIVTYIRHFKIKSVVTEPSTGINMEVNQVIARAKTYLFQHAVFYTEDLEILPGQDMNLSGKIHTNKNMYLDAGTELTVNTDYVQASGDIFNKRKNNGSRAGGDVNLLDKSSGNYKKIMEDGDFQPMDSEHPDWVTDSQTRWGGTVKSGEHGVTALATPIIPSIQPDGYFADNSDVKVVNGNIYSGTTQLFEGIDIPVGTVVTDTTFYNNREAKVIKMTSIDMEKLAGWEQQVDDNGDPVFDTDGNPVMVRNYPNRMPSNGLMYATRDDAGSGQQNGIRLRNGSLIDTSNGLTLVSDIPVYIQGNYNTVNKKPTSVISDAVNFLSNSWDDSNSTDSVNQRVASNTTVNTAFISGIVPTEGSDYSGGFENLPRMHEKWSGKTLSIKGAFGVLWESQVGVGKWHYGDPQYKAPARDWDYDTDFNDQDNLPPYTPSAVGATRIAWWEG